MSATHDATFYVQVEPDFYGGGNRNLRGLRAVAMTKTRPRRPRPGAVLVKLTLRVPDAVFLPLRPEAVVVVPESMAVVGPIEALVGDPR